MGQTFENLLEAGKMAKDVAASFPGVGSEGEPTGGDGEVGGVLVVAHVSAGHPGRRLVGRWQIIENTRKMKNSPQAVWVQVSH